MELALPHVVVRMFGPGIGADVVAALSLQPVEVSEARDAPEASRVASGRPAILVVVVASQDSLAAIMETRGIFPGVPILLVADPGEQASPESIPLEVGIQWISATLPVQAVCWHVLEAISRAALTPGLVDRPLGPVVIEIDEGGRVTSDATLLGELMLDGHSLRHGDSILPFIATNDRTLFVRTLELTTVGDATFCCLRLAGDHGGRHAVSVGLRKLAVGHITLLVQPLICGGPIVGRHINNHDPITGLLTRWAMSRALESHECRAAKAGAAALVLLKLEGFSAISNCIGHRLTDDVLVRVASALSRVFPYPARNSRLMGDVFLTYLPRHAADVVRCAEELIASVNRIEVPEFSTGFSPRASVGIADVPGGDHDLAVRLAEAAAGEALAAGGNRAIVAGSATFTRAQTDELTSSMDLGAWEVWLQPVVRSGDGRVEFHEALARFGVWRRSMASRADYFTAGRAEGLLERFDRMMLLRAVDMVAEHDAKLSVNVSYETFVSAAFPQCFLDVMKRATRGCERLILEIAPRCVAASQDIVQSRLRQLAEAGVAVAIDDFGSGICRLRYLTQFPLAIVKLDELVTGYVDDDPLQREFVRTVVSLCRARGIVTVAEYTRSPEQLARLVEDGVELFQGELFGMPRPADAVLRPGAVGVAGA